MCTLEPASTSAMAPRFFAPRSSGFAHRFEHMPKQVTTGVTAREPTELDKAVLEQPTFMGEFWSGPPANRPRARKEMFAAEVRRRKHILAWIKDAEREVIGGAGATATPRDERAIAARQSPSRTTLAVNLQPRKAHERTHQAMDRVLRPRVHAQAPAPKARNVACHVRHSTVRFTAPPGKLVVAVGPTCAKSCPGERRAAVPRGRAQGRRGR